VIDPEDDSLAIFGTSDNSRIAKITTGDDHGGGGAVGDPGAEMAEERVSVIDTATMTISAAIDGPDRPRALLVTNDGDAEDADELLVVPEFYGEPTAEARDDGRTGRVRVYQLSDLAPTQAITFAPVDSGVQRAGAPAGTTVKTSPNQLWSVSTRGSRIYVTSVSASPEGPPRFDNNVFPVVYVADLATRAEITGVGGTTNLARKVLDAIPSPTPSRRPMSASHRR
jgi:hypothetical protein